VTEEERGDGCANFILGVFVIFYICANVGLLYLLLRVTADNPAGSGMRAVAAIYIILMILITLFAENPDTTGGLYLVGAVITCIILVWLDNSGNGDGLAAGAILLLAAVLDGYIAKS
jgi:hypothetical protein